MKKSFLFLLVLALMLGSVCSLAETETTLPRVNETVISAQEEAEEEVTKAIDALNFAAPERPELEVEKVSPAEAVEDERAATSDQVSISGNSYKIVIPGALTINYTAPSGIIAFTQDLAQQSSAYNTYFKAPKDAVDDFIKYGMHLDIYDPRTGVDIYLYVFLTDISKLYPNSNAFTQDEAIYLIRYMFKDKDYFQMCDEATFGWDGGNVWLIGDGIKSGNGMRLCAFVNGLEIYGVANAKSNDDYNEVIDLLDNLSIY